MERKADTMVKSEVFHKAIAAFGKTYADQTEGDLAAFNKRFAKVGSRFRQRPETRRHYPEKVRWTISPK